MDIIIPVRSIMAKKTAPRRQRKMKSKRTQKKKAVVARDELRVVCKSEFIAVPQQGVTVSNYYYWTQSIWNSANLLDITKNQTFLYNCLQYDRWRIHSVTVTVVPKGNVMDAGQAQNDGTYVLNGDGLIHTVLDRDGVGPQNIGQLQRYSSYKAYSVLKKFSRTYAVKYPTDVWLDCQRLTTADGDNLRNNLGLQGHITLYGENFLEDNYEFLNEPWAVVKLAYNVSFQGRTGNNMTVTVDNDGNPILAEIRPLTFDSDKQVCPPKGIKGTINDSLIVDEANDTTDIPPTTGAVI